MPRKGQSLLHLLGNMLPQWISSLITCFHNCSVVNKMILIFTNVQNLVHCNKHMLINNESNQISN